MRLHENCSLLSFFSYFFVCVVFFFVFARCTVLELMLVLRIFFLQAKSRIIPRECCPFSQNEFVNTLITLITRITLNIRFTLTKSSSD